MAEKSMDAITLLKEDHAKVKQLFRDFEASGARAFSTRKRIGDAIRQELEVHTRIEEDIFYPGVQSSAPEMIAEAIEEHHVVDRILEELEQIEPADEKFTAKMTVLIENVEHHAEEEEKELFPGVKRDLGAEKMREMGEQMSRRKADLKRRQAA